ncbi:MAG TPA: hypothetical protein VN083_00390, partial [Vicinamibacteria bacterium]|nr:hypothetical protein [Vicinamibacteria bacterium]
RCLKCHAPGPQAASVSCETCHGPGKAYLVPHRQDSFYSGPDRKGMRDLYTNAGAIATLCVTCHVLGAEDKDIAAAGHATGADFDAGAKLKTMSHWPSDESEGVSAAPRKRVYDAAFYGTVSTRAKPMVAARIQALGTLSPKAAGPGPGAGPAPPKLAPVLPKSGPPAAIPPEPPPATGADGFREVQAGELIKLLPDPPSGTFAPPPARRAAPPPSRAPEVAPGPEPAPPPSTTPGPPPSSPSSSSSPSSPPSSPPATPPATPLAPADPRVEASRLVVRLLRQKKSVPIAPPRGPAEIRGENGELFSVEDEILRLALQALRRPEP